MSHDSKSNRTAFGHMTRVSPALGYLAELFLLVAPAAVAVCLFGLNRWDQALRMPVARVERRLSEPRPNPVLAAGNKLRGMVLAALIRNGMTEEVEEYLGSPDFAGGTNSGGIREYKKFGVTVCYSRKILSRPGEEEFRYRESITNVSAPSLGDVLRCLSEEP